MRTFLSGLSVALSLVLLGVACGSSGNDSGASSTGAGASGGSSSTGAGGSTSTGGNVSAGGNVSTGGSATTGGSGGSTGGAAPSVGGSGGTPAAGGAPSAGAGGVGLGAGGVGGHSSPMCDAYIACEGATAPQGLAGILAAYGKSGSCWDQGNPTLCDDACHAGLVAEHKLFPAADSCNVCKSSADCPSALPACDVTSSRCVTCLANGDCKDGKKPACDVASRTCVTCTANGDCTSPDAGVCDVGAHGCVGCLTNADCKQSFATICDQGQRQCRGCEAPSECPSGLCTNGSCVECQTDAQCSAPLPRCFDNGKCVQCLDNSDCALGGCDTLIGYCCGANACKNQGLECGTALDLVKCGFTSIPCGDCPSGKTCVENHCLVPPANTCKTMSCPTGNCGYVPADNAYECIEHNPTCDTSKMPPQECSAGFICLPYTDPNTGKKYDYCNMYCLVDSDCPGMSTCKPLDTPGGLGTCG